MKKKYQSKILRAIHEDAEGMHKLGIISDAEMREFDEDCLVKEPIKTRKISGSVGTRQTVSISAKSV
jgi:DNA-binding transcriptional regulator YiaG